MLKNPWNEITREDVLKAICLFEAEHPIHPEARSTFWFSTGRDIRQNIFAGWHIKFILVERFKKGNIPVDWIRYVFLRNWDLRCIIRIGV